MKTKPMNVQDLIDLLNEEPDKSLPIFAFSEWSEDTYAFQRGDLGIAHDSYLDNQEKKNPAVYLLVLRCQDEPA